MEILIYSDDWTNVKISYFSYLNYHFILHLAMGVHTFIMSFDL